MHKTTALYSYGQHIHWAPWGYRASVLKCIRRLEREQGRPVYMVEIAQKMDKDSYWPVPHIAVIMMAVYDLYRADEVLCDRELNMMSVNPKH